MFPLVGRMLHGCYMRLGQHTHIHTYVIVVTQGCLRFRPATFGKEAGTFYCVRLILDIIKLEVVTQGYVRLNDVRSAYLRHDCTRLAFYCIHYIRCISQDYYQGTYNLERLKMIWSGYLRHV